MDYTDLLGDKYARRNTVTSVAPEATGADSNDVEAGQGATTDKPANKPGASSSRKSGTSPSNRKQA